MANTSSTDELLLKISRSVDILVRLKLQEVRGEKSQTDMILFLNSMGCSPTEIANLLGTSTSTVNPILSRSRQSKSK